MRLMTIAAALLLSSPALALLDQSAPGIVKQSGQFVSAGGAQMGLAVTTGTTLTVPSGAVMAEICVEGASVRYRDDGTNPTTSVGIPFTGCMNYAGPLTAISFTAVSGSPTLDVLYYK